MSENFKPTEELVNAARAALTEEGPQEFWAEVAERLDEYGTEKTITPRPVARE